MSANKPKPKAPNEAIKTVTRDTDNPTNGLISRHDAPLPTTTPNGGEKDLDSQTSAIGKKKGVPSAINAWPRRNIPDKETQNTATSQNESTIDHVVDRRDRQSHGRQLQESEARNTGSERIEEETTRLISAPQESECAELAEQIVTELIARRDKAIAKAVSDKKYVGFKPKIPTQKFIQKYANYQTQKWSAIKHDAETLAKFNLNATENPPPCDINTWGLCWQNVPGDGNCGPHVAHAGGIKESAKDIRKIAFASMLTVKGMKAILKHMGVKAEGGELNYTFEMAMFDASDQENDKAEASQMMIAAIAIIWDCDFLVVQTSGPKRETICSAISGKATGKKKVIMASLQDHHYSHLPPKPQKVAYNAKSPTLIHHAIEKTAQPELDHEGFQVVINKKDKKKAKADARSTQSSPLPKSKTSSKPRRDAQSTKTAQDPEQDKKIRPKRACVGKQVHRFTIDFMGQNGTEPLRAQNQKDKLERQNSLQANRQTSSPSPVAQTEAREVTNEASNQADAQLGADAETPGGDDATISEGASGVEAAQETSPPPKEISKCGNCGFTAKVGNNRRVKAHTCTRQSHQKQIKADPKKQAFDTLVASIQKAATTQEGAGEIISFLESRGRQPRTGPNRYEGPEKVEYHARMLGTTSANTVLAPPVKRLETESDITAVEACYPRGETNPGGTTMDDMKKFRADNAEAINQIAEKMGINEKLVSDALQGLSRSPAGASGVTARDMIALTRDAKTMEAVIFLVKGIIKDDLTDSECKAVTQAKGTALLKPNGTIRPIAKSEIIVKIAERIALNAAKGVYSKLGAQDFGVSNQNGVEAAIHTTRTILGKKVYAIKSDAKNAFGSMSRLFMAETVRTEAPELLGVFLSCTGRGNDVGFEAEIEDGEPSIQWINQTRGLNQGSSLSPLFFSLSMTRALEATRKKWVSKVLILAYLDDIILFASSLKHLEEAFRDVQEALKRAGLEFNLDKCEMHSTCNGGEPTEEETALVQKLGIKNSPMFLEYLGATVSSFEPIHDRSARILAPTEAKMETLRQFVGSTMVNAAAKPIPGERFAIHSTLFKMLLKSINALDTFILRVHPTEMTSPFCDKLNKLKFDLFIQIGLPINEKERVDFQKFAQDLDELKKLALEPCFVHGRQGMNTGMCDSIAAATMRRMFLPNRMGGGGLQDAWARSVAGYISSYTAAQSRVQAILPLMGLHEKETPATVIYDKTRMDAMHARRGATEKEYTEKRYPHLKNQNAFKGAPRGAQRSLMDVFNICGAYAVFERYEASDVKSVASFASKQEGIYHLFIWANQNFRPNKLSREEYRFAICGLIGMEHPAKPKCMGCGEEHQEGALEHSIRCSKLGGKGIIGAMAKTGVVNGTRGYTKLHVPSWEPKYANFANPPPPKKGKTKAYVKKKADLEIRGYAGEIKLVDVTATGTFPPGLNAHDARTRGYIAKLREEKKANETLGWKANPKVEFVPFAIDLHGAVAPKALAYKSWLRQQAKPQDGNELEKRVFSEHHPGRFWEQVTIQLIKGCAAACYKRSFGTWNVANKKNTNQSE